MQHLSVDTSFSDYPCSVFACAPIRTVICVSNSTDLPAIWAACHNKTHRESSSETVRYSCHSDGGNWRVSANASLCM